MHKGHKTILWGLIGCALAAHLGSGCAASSTPVKWTQIVEEEAYPLDEEHRKLRGALVCPEVQTHEYAGDILPYHRPVKVNPFFRERLQQFEQVVLEVAQRTFDTGDVVIRHFGTHNCRTIRGKRKLSEHAFANAIDVSGFEIRRGNDLITISLKKHWWGSDARAQFLHDVAFALAERPDIFRGMLGPGDPGHEDHFHFDMGSHRYLDIHVPN